MKKILFLAILAASLLELSCANHVPFREGSFILKRNETVRVAELDLAITNNGCGRKWMNDDPGGGYEWPYCELVLTRGGKTTRAGNDFKPVYLGNIEVRLEKLNPWDKTEDSLPPGGCRVHVKLLEGR